MIDFKLEIIDRDSSVRINRSVHSEAKDMFWGLIGGLMVNSLKRDLLFF